MRSSRRPLGPSLLAVLVFAVVGPTRADDASSDVEPGALDALTAADRERSHLDPAATGVWLSALPEVGVVARDPVAALTVGVGVEHPLAALHLRAPVTLRPLDLPPRDVHPLSPAPCTFVRCAEWTSVDTGQLAPETLVRLVDEVRVGHPGEIFHLRLEPMRARLGTGALVDGVMTSPNRDTRRVGAFVDAGLPSRALVAQAFVGDVVRAADLAALAVEVRPLAFLPGGRDDLFTRFLDRAALRVEGAVDFGLEPGLPSELLGVSVPPAAPLAALSTHASWSLLEDRAFLGVTPFVGGSALSGLSSSGNRPTVGGGVETGASFALRLPGVGLRSTGALTASTPGHRPGLFGPLYFVERERALVGVAKGTLRDVPAPGGLGALVDVEAAVLSLLRAGARLRLDPTPSGNTLELSLEAALFGARLAAYGVTRGFSLSLLAPRVDEADLGAIPVRSLGTLELAIPLWGPLSFSTRATWTPRVDAASRVRFDPDVLVGLSGDIAVDSPVFSWL